MMFFIIMVLWCVFVMLHIIMVLGVLLVMVYIIMVQWCVIGDGLYYHGTVVCCW